MQFEYTSRHSGRSPVTGVSTFRVDRLRGGTFEGAARSDITHLIDRTYRYHSRQELRWHLAERLGTSPAMIHLIEAERHGARLSPQP